MTWVNLLRMQFIEILEFYDENPDRFQYKELKKAYDALLSVKSVEEFKQWRKLLKDYGLSFTDMDGIAHKDNQLGIHDDYAEGANDKILDVFIRWKLSFNPLKWMEMENWNRELVDILLKATKREEDVHIVIFPCGKPNAKRWAAIGQDADRLFEVFGWQTGHVSATTGPVSWMFINGYGLDVLRQSGYSIKFIDYGEFDIISEAFEEDITASLQQFVDYLRMMTNLTTEMQDFMKKLHPISVPVNGYHELMEGKLKMLKDGVSVIMPDGKMIPLAEGHNWRLDALGRSCMRVFLPKIGEA